MRRRGRYTAAKNSGLYFERNDFSCNGPPDICRRALIDSVCRHRVNLRGAKLSSIPAIDPRDQLCLPTTLMPGASLTSRRRQNSSASTLGRSWRDSEMPIFAGVSSMTRANISARGSFDSPRCRLFDETAATVATRGN